MNKPAQSLHQTPLTKKRPPTQVRTQTAGKAPKKPNNGKSLLLFVILASIFVLIMLFLANFTNFKDYVLANAYRPTPETSALEHKLALTDSGDLIFRASQPALHQTNFSDFCATSDAETSILGCYSERQIHLYQIDAPELAGIVESTAAHELLHAVWERLPGHQKDQLMGSLNQIYQEHYQELEIVASYPDSAKATELYARIGTEITTLPADLEAHYATYFTDRTAVVAFYDAYSDTFSELSSALSSISTEIEALEPQIEAEKTAYATKSSEYAAAVAEFNACAEQAGCFTASAFAARRSELLASETALDALYATLSSRISRYNALVEAYNSNLLKERELIKIINPRKE